MYRKSRATYEMERRVLDFKQWVGMAAWISFQVYSGGLKVEDQRLIFVSLVIFSLVVRID